VDGGDARPGRLGRALGVADDHPFLVDGEEQLAHRATLEPERALPIAWIVDDPDAVLDLLLIEAARGALAVAQALPVNFHLVPAPRVLVALGRDHVGLEADVIDEGYGQIVERLAVHGAAQRACAHAATDVLTGGPEAEEQLPGVRV